MPENHKEFIYHQLYPKDLIRLGMANKELYLHPVRKKVMIRKLVEEYFYKNNSKVIQDWYLFQKFDKEYLFDLYYCEKLQTINFTKDIVVFENEETSHARRLKIQKYKFNSHSSFEIFTKDYNHLQLNIIFFIEKIIKFPHSDKIKIIQNIVQYMFDLLTYARNKSQEFHVLNVLNRINPYFDFYHLFHNCFHTFLSQLFKDDDNLEIKLEIIYALLKLEKNTQNYPSANYTLNDFIEILVFEYSDLKRILETARILQNCGVGSNTIAYLFHFQFSIFFNLNPDEDLIEYDYCAKDMEKQLENPEFKNEFYSMVRTFDPRGNFILSLHHSIVFRMMRYRGEIDDIYDTSPEEDYDY